MAMNYRKWAEVLRDYSLNIQPKEWVIIVGDPLTSLPLIEACYASFLEKGAEVDLLLQPSKFKELHFAHASAEMLAKTPRLWQFGAENADKYLVIGASSNTRALTQFSADKQTISSHAYRPILDAILGRSSKNKLAWCRTQFPTESLAQEAGMGSYEFELFSERACFLHLDDPVAAWRSLERQQQNLLEFLTGIKELHFENDKGTDLKVDVSGMTWVNCCGHFNFPDGEVFTGPNLKAPQGGVNGHVYYSFPTIYKDVEVEGIDLTFEKGRVVKATASRGEEQLRTMLALDPGASYIGEVALGTNYGIQRGTKSILFDEKIGGTFHMAAGKGYPETGNTNHSALHWDMICDMRQNATIRADGKIIFENGHYLSANWPGNTP